MLLVFPPSPPVVVDLLAVVFLVIPFRSDVGIIRDAGVLLGGDVVNYGVNYTSRRAEGVETIMLKGWFWPAIAENTEGKDSVLAPRIVLQHGFESNSNMFGELNAAFELRKLGYAVLVNNLRDHGWSEESKNHIIEWGDAYPFDVLGAWDFLANDPDDIIGGSLPAAKVGIMGFSLGAFTAANAFGLDSNVPAVWLDSPLYTPKRMALGVAERLTGSYSLGWLGRLIGPAVWDGVDEYAKERGVDLQRHLPEKQLPDGPDTKRPVMVISHPEDPVVQHTEVELVRAVLQKYPGKYYMEQFDGDFDPKECNGFVHCLTIAVQPELYLPKLCRFWKVAFGLNAELCVP